MQLAQNGNVLSRHMRALQHLRTPVKCTIANFAPTRRDILKSASLPLLSALAVRPISAASARDSAIPSVKLTNGVEMPLLGLGTWRITPNSSASSAVDAAIKAGYTHIDTAKAYKNEGGVGEGISSGLREVGKKREDLFVVTKLFNDDHARVENACRDSLHRLGLDYLDLYLVHWPCSQTPGPQLTPPYKDTWRAMERLVDQGLVRSIGVSNMTAKKLEDLLSYANIKPVVNQIEIHPYWRNKKTLSFCEANGIHCTAYSPLGSISATAQKGARLVSEDPEVTQIAESTGRSVSQVLLRWGLEKGHSIIPKAATEAHILENRRLFDFELPLDAIQKLDSLSHQERTCKGDFCLDDRGPYRTLDELWDGEGY